jgi:hypothetical protein
MHYSYEIDITTADDIDAPVVFPIKLQSGILTEFDLVFEVGDGYSSCVSLWDKTIQLLPNNSEGYYSGDGIRINAPLYHKLSEIGNDLYIVAWNRGGIYDHTVSVMLSVKGDNEPDVTDLMDKLLSVIDNGIDLIKKWM